MVEKKATTKKAAEGVAEKKPAVKKTTTRKPAAKKAELVVNAENAGFKAGDVYQTLATAGKALSVAEIAKEAKITAEEAILGMGWLLKEGKIKGEEGLVTLA